jgi:hypothetical protein
MTEQEAIVAAENSGGFVSVSARSVDREGLRSLRLEGRRADGSVRCGSVLVPDGADECGYWPDAVGFLLT